MRVVLDTNVYISGIWWPGSKAARLLVLALEGRYALYTSKYQLQELRRVAEYPKFKTKPGADFEAWFAEIQAVARVVRPAPVPRRVLADPADLPILGTAVAAKADLLVSGDRQHLLPLGRYGKTDIVPVALALEVLGGR